ncbi:universal stress protein [Natrialbaceae archaeon A-CW2]|uniref:universal stress protein n=1 Tax=Natronosalvus amylolyticus TaxID=2961994 RepID=UPI0020C9A5D8|nr:universal stress protein [Natronosalvus amylolyticus]
MSNAPHRVLVPVEILRGQMVPETIVETFSSVPVVLLGYHELPDQTAPSQARNQFEDKAQDELDALVTAFENAGGDVTKRLVFTHDAMKTFERLAVEHACDSVLLLNPAPILDDVLVPIRGDVNVEHIARLVGSVAAGTDIAITLLHVASDDDDGRAVGESLLEEATATLEETGVHRSRVTQSVVVDDDPLEVILEAADDHDLVVLGEDRPSVRELIFGETSEIVAEQAVCPVLVVRRRYLESNGENASSSGVDGQ